MKSLSLNHKILDRLISPADYAKHERKSPFILNVKNDVQEILLYGSSHSTNWQNPKFAELEALFNAFIKRHTQNKVVVVVENSVPDKVSDKKQIIQTLGESGYICWLAIQSKIELFCIEPSFKQLLSFIYTRNHQKEDLALWLFLNHLINKVNRTSAILQSNEIELNELINKISKDAGTKVDYSVLVKRLNKLAARILLPQKLADLKKHKIDIKSIKELENPFSSLSPTNRVGCDINLARDYFMTENIVSLLKKGYNVFGALGINHVISQKSVYDYYLNNK